MSEPVYEQMREGLDEALTHAKHSRIMLDQATIAFNALMLISNGEPGARAIAQDALNRIIAKIPELSSPTE